MTTMATAEQRTFLDKIGPMAAANMQKTGILASLTIAQAILESGWGKSGLTLKANNLFGVKGTYNGASLSCKTQEWDGSKYITITAAFRKYPSWAESVADHSALFLRLDRYKNLRGCTDYKKACQYVREDGYATDPAYTTKLIRIIEAYGLTQYDAQETASTGNAGSEERPVNTSSGASTFSVGSVVLFAGNVHYTSASATTGKPCKPGMAKVTRIVKGEKHPYHLIGESGESTVYGWVDAADVKSASGTTKKMRVGARVKYTGPLYRDSNGNGRGKIVNGVFMVKYYYPGCKCGVHIDGLGWVPESACSLVG